MFLNIILLVVSLLVLTVSADLLVRGAVRLALAWGLSSFFIGVTIVGFGTSAPELATSVSAALRGSADIAMGNAIGSNIFNLAVILGIAALVYPIAVERAAVRREVPLVLLTGMLVMFFGYTGGFIGRLEAAVLFAVLGVILWRQYAGERQKGDVAPVEEVVGAAATGRGRALLFVGMGLLGLILASQLLVYSAVNIARASGLSELVISLTIISAGTSAPELVTSLAAAVRRQSDISVGNVLGSNIFNTLAIIGAAALVKPQAVQAQALQLDFPVMLLVSAACLPIMWSGGRISRGEGVLLLAGYLVYLCVLLWLAPQWFA